MIDLKKYKYGELNKPVDENDFFEFTEEEDAQIWGENLYHNWGKDYKKSVGIVKLAIKNNLIADSLSSYCGDMYREINEHLRLGLDSKNYEILIMAMTMAMSFAPRLDRSLIVYRLVSDEVIEQLIKSNKDENAPFHEKGFMSTSLVKSTICNNEDFLNYNNLLKIYVEKGEVGIYSNVIVRRNEQEMIFMPNNYLGLIKYPYVDKDSGRKIYECRLISIYNKNSKLRYF